MAEPAAASTPATRAREVRVPWGRHPGENDLWYARFLRYVALGPTRSVSLVATGQRNHYPVPAHWPMQAAQLNWRERSRAFDEAYKKDPKKMSNDFSVLIGSAQLELSISPVEKTKLKGVDYQAPPDEDEDYNEPSATV